MSNQETVDLITVTGAEDAIPKISAYTPFHADATGFEDLVRGDGTAITDGEQLVVLDVTLASGETGETLVTTPYDGDLSRVFPLSRWVQTFPGFADALECATEGSRVAIALAPGDVEGETAASLGLAEDESAIAVVDVRKVYLTQAEGADQYNDARGMPTVVRDSDGRPGIIVPDATAPDELVVQTLIKGDGPEVTGEQPVRVQYTAVTWDDRKVFDTTWDTEPKSVTGETVVPGVAEALIGATVGSQILVVVPPELGFGDQQQGGIAANSTLVYVIDILGIDEAAAQ